MGHAPCLRNGLRLSAILLVGMGVRRLNNRRRWLDLTTPTLTLPLQGGGNRFAYNLSFAACKRLVEAGATLALRNPGFILKL